MDNAEIIKTTKFYHEYSDWINSHIITKNGEIYDLNNNRIYGYIIKGYPYVTIKSNSGKTKYVAIHTIIANCLIDNPKNLSIVRHKNCNRSDYSPKNLEWSTKSDIIKIAKYKNLINRSTKEVLATNKTNNEIKEFSSVNECSVFFGVASNTISQWIRHPKKNTEWDLRYKNEIEEICVDSFTSSLKDGSIKSHPKYEGYYADFVKSRIISTRRGKPQILKLLTDINGYIQCTLRYNNKTVTVNLHRFLYECKNNIVLPSSIEVDHIDNDHTNNCIDNLQQLDKRDNISKSSSKVVEVCYNNGIVKKFTSVKDCAVTLQVSEPTIRKWTKEKTKHMQRLNIRNIIIL